MQTSTVYRISTKKITECYIVWDVNSGIISSHKLNKCDNGDFCPKESFYLKSCESSLSSNNGGNLKAEEIFMTLRG